MNSSKSRKALNFDINSNLLRKYYPSKNYRRGWKDIKSFLENSGFIHRQYSGYVLKDDIAMTDVIYLAKEMSKRLTWLKKCVKEFDVTIVGDEYCLVDNIIEVDIHIEEVFVI